MVNIAIHRRNINKIKTILFIQSLYAYLLALKYFCIVKEIMNSSNNNSYTHNPNGNRTSMNRPAVNLPSPNAVTNTSCNEANQMLIFNDKTMTYDENGNMTSVTNSCGTTAYTWDARNRLVGIAGYKPDCTSLTATFKYDALGRRIEKTINGRTIQYLYDGLDIIQEIENSIVIVNYIRTLNIDEPLARIESNGTVRYYQTDALGSIITLTDENGDIRTNYSYDPYGSVVISGETSDNSFQYTGRENDGTELHYYRFRYYSPELQRFISEDPIRLKGGINFYAHVGNNPVNWIDPLGLFSSGNAMVGGYLMGIGKGAGDCAAGLVEMGAIARQVRSGKLDDLYGHCLAHCKVRKACGKGLGDALSLGISYGKESYDWAKGKIFGGRDWDPVDIDANEQGRTCPKEKSCEEQCKNTRR
jgi:RHS repeat-associated protein